MRAKQQSQRETQEKRSFFASLGFYFISLCAMWRTDIDETDEDELIFFPRSARAPKKKFLFSFQKVKLNEITICAQFLFFFLFIFTWNKINFSSFFSICYYRRLRSLLSFHRKWNSIVTHSINGTTETTKQQFHSISKKKKTEKKGIFFVHIFSLPFSPHHKEQSETMTTPSERESSQRRWKKSGKEKRKPKSVEWAQSRNDAKNRNKRSEQSLKWAITMP